MVLTLPRNINGSRLQATAPRVPPTILTYTYNSKLVYVTPGETYEVRLRLPLRFFFCLRLRVQQAIDFAREAFSELKDVDPSMIYLEVRVVLNNQAERKTARIGRMAWAPVISTLAQYEIVEVHVDSPPVVPSPAPQPSITQPPPYASDVGWYTEMKGAPTSETSFGPASSQHSHQSSFTTRVVGLFSQRSSRPDHS